MKKFVFITLFSLTAVLGMAQGVKTAATVQLDGNESDTVLIYNTKGLASLAIELVCTEIGGTSDGSAYVQASLDGSTFSTLTSGDFASVDFLTNDTLTIADGAHWLVHLQNPAFYVYRVIATGTASDTTSIVVKYKQNDF